MSHDDPARDPHLRKALHHAPDRDAAPPPALSAAILQAARAAAKPAAPRATPWWRRWLEVQPMQWAGAAAGLLVAVLVGRLWWDNAPELREPAPPAASVAARPPVPASAPPAAPAPEAAAARGTAGAHDDNEVREALKAERPMPEHRAEGRQQPAAVSDQAKEAIAKPEPPLAKAAAPAAPAPPPAPAPAPAQAPAPSPAPVAPSGLAQQETERRQDAAAPALRARVPAAEGQASMPPLNFAPAPASAVPAGAISAEPPGVGRLRQSAAEPSGWVWERRASELSGAPPVPQSAWLQLLLNASAGRWQPQLRDTQPPGESLAWIATWRDHGELRAIVSLQGPLLWWREPDGSTWTAALPPDAAGVLAQPPR